MRVASKEGEMTKCLFHVNLIRERGQFYGPFFLFMNGRVELLGLLTGCICCQYFRFREELRYISGTDI